MDPKQAADQATTREPSQKNPQKQNPPKAGYSIRTTSGDSISGSSTKLSPS